MFLEMIFQKGGSTIFKVYGRWLYTFVFEKIKLGNHDGRHGLLIFENDFFDEKTALHDCSKTAYKPIKIPRSNTYSIEAIKRFSWYLYFI